MSSSLGFEARKRGNKSTDGGAFPKSDDLACDMRVCMSCTCLVRSNVADVV